MLLYKLHIFIQSIYITLTVTFTDYLITLPLLPCHYWYDRLCPLQAKQSSICGRGRGQVSLRRPSRSSLENSDGKQCKPVTSLYVNKNISSLLHFIDSSPCHQVFTIFHSQSLHISSKRCSEESNISSFFFKCSLHFNQSGPWFSFSTVVIISNKKLPSFRLDREEGGRQV